MPTCYTFSSGHSSRSGRRFFRYGLVLAAVLAGCAAPTPDAERGRDFGMPATAILPVLDRVTWGANTSTYREAQAIGINRYLDAQLHPRADQLPLAVEAQINAMTITQRPMDALVVELEQRRKQSDAIANDDEKKAAQQAYQNELSRLAREAA